MEKNWLTKKQCIHKMKYSKFYKNNDIDLYLLTWKYVHDVILSWKAVYSTEYTVLFSLGELCTILDVLKKT